MSDQEVVSTGRTILDNNSYGRKIYNILQQRVHHSEMGISYKPLEF